MTNQTIFISHSTRDDDHIDRIADALQKAGHTVWVDHRNGIIPGTPSWDKEIRMAIKNADVGVFVMSENSLDSGICGAECLLVQELNKPLYVLRLQDCKPENIWLYIKQIQYADLVKNFDDGMNAFLSALGGAKGAELPTAYLTTVTGRDTLRIYLPYLKNPLRGRNADVEAIQALIGPHITQIIGVGGWGKSRISAEIALAYPNGAVWHRCSDVSSHTDLLRLFRTHLDLPDETKPDDVLARLGQFKPLVVVDNAEDVAQKTDVREAYVMLIRQVVANDVPVLITTRRLWDEFKPRKQYPPPQLPIEIASQITADFAHSQNIPLTLDQADALATAARLHPRLIEFAVLLIPEIGYDVALRRLKSLKDDDIQEALDDMIRKTLDQMRDEAKHGAEAYALIHNLTWLNGTFTVDAARALAPASLADDEDAVINALTTLGRYQFVPFDMNSGRYGLVDVVRDTLGKPKDPAIFDAYADFYIKRAHAIFVDLEDKPELWSEHQADFADIKALGNALLERTHNGTSGDLSRAMRFAENTSVYVQKRMEERLWGWLEMGLNAVRELQKTATDDDDKALQKTEVRLLFRQGGVWSNLGEKQKALELYEIALPLCRASGDKKGEAAILGNMGIVWSDLGDKQKALDLHEQSLALERAVGNRGGEAIILGNIGTVWQDLGDNQKALELYEQSLTLKRAVGDRGGEAATLNNMGAVWWNLGENQKALGLYEQALPMYRAVGDRGGEANTLGNMGHVWSDLGDNQKALDLYEQSLVLKRAVGDRGGEASSLVSIGLVWSDLGEKQKALDLYEQALPMYRAVGDRGGEALTLGNMGAVWQNLGENQKALDYYQQAIPLYEAIGNKRAYANTLRNMGLLYYQQGNLDDAIAYVERAIATTYAGDPRIPQWQGSVTRFKSQRDIRKMLGDEAE